MHFLVNNQPCFPSFYIKKSEFFKASRVKVESNFHALSPSSPTYTTPPLSKVYKSRVGKPKQEAIALSLIRFHLP